MKRPSPATNTPDFPPPQPPNPRNKKTRELPNLSDCFGCNRRINSTNPKNKLGILGSEWRIVLLCKSCYNLVESSQFCSYCFTRVSSAFFDCKKCRRRIHKDCVTKFSFGESGISNSCDEFSVCFDCWIPKSLEIEYKCNRTVRNGTSKKQSGKNVEKGKDVENEANVDVVKKIVLAIEAREKVFTKVIAAKKAVEIANGALGIVAKDKDGDNGGSMADEDAQLAIRLHREMNSSPRISGNLCLLNTHCVDVPKVNGLESRIANETNCSNGVEIGSLLDQKRTELGRPRVGKCKGNSNGYLITYIRKGQGSEVVKCKQEPNSPLKVYSRKPSLVEKLEAVECPSQVVEVEVGQSSKTYIRRRLLCKSKLVNSSLKIENGNLATDMSLICREEPRAFANAS